MPFFVETNPQDASPPGVERYISRGSGDVPTSTATSTYTGLSEAENTALLAAINLLEADGRNPTTDLRVNISTKAAVPDPDTRPEIAISILNNEGQPAAGNGVVKDLPFTVRFTRIDQPTFTGVLTVDAFEENWFCQFENGTEDINTTRTVAQSFDARSNANIKIQNSPVDLIVANARITAQRVV